MNKESSSHKKLERAGNEEIATTVAKTSEKKRNKRHKRKKSRTNNLKQTHSQHKTLQKKRNNDHHKGSKPHKKLKKNPKQSHPFAPPPLSAPIVEIREANPAGNKTLTKNALSNKAKSPDDHSNMKTSSTTHNQRYAVLFFSTFTKAKASANSIKEAAQNCDQLNLVIAEEGDMQDPTLLSIHNHIALFAGKAWEAIHQRRKQEGWYKEAINSHRSKEKIQENTPQPLQNKKEKNSQKEDEKKIDEKPEAKTPENN